MTTTPWLMTELALISAQEYDNPFAEVQLSASFTCGGQSVTRPAFWDGGRTWRIRFAPPAAGRWTWTTTCSDTANAGLHGQQGTIACEPYAGSNPNYVHGPLTISANRRHFIRRDGTPFFWLGDTHWQMPDKERLNENNAPDAEGRSQFEQLLQDRLAKRFTVYQTYLVGHAAHWWRDAGFTCIDPSRFQAVMDPMLDRLADAGMVVALGIGLYVTALKVPRASLVRLAEYVAARYGAHPIVWITAQEVDQPDREGQPTTDVPAWTAAAEAFARTNGVGIPVTGHMKAGARSTLWGQEPWHDFFALQGGHPWRTPRSGVRSHDEYAFYWKHQPTKPFLETEAMYEAITCGTRFADDRDVRMAAWKALLSGSYGYTYGGAAVWLLKWDQADPCGERYNPGTWWHAGMNLPGSRQMTHLKAFFEALEWWRLEPRFADETWCGSSEHEDTVLASDGNRVVVLYVCGRTPVQAELRRLDPERRYRARWFDPRAGAWLDAGAVVTTPAGTWRVPEIPTPEDWVLLLQ